MISNLKKLGILLALISSAIISSYHWVYSKKVYPYFRVGGVELSNLSLEEAKQRLGQAVPQELPTIELMFGNQSWPIKLEELLIVYEPERTAQAAYLLGRSSGWGEDMVIKWRLWWEKKDTEMKFSFDEKKFEEAIELVAGQIEQPPILPELRLETSGLVQLIPAKNGRLIKKQKLRQELLNQIGYRNY